jgi:tRNA/tmRNA/rRNA uracil-C5-methylase (TrmA/RlmC/RlmD family)
VSPRTPLSDEPRTAHIDGFTHGGEGVARIEGKAVFVADTLPGEEVVLRVVDDRKRWARAELLEVVTPSPDRVEPPCPYAPRPGRPGCGGCDLQHAAPDAQRRLKTRVVREQLERLGRLTDPPVEDCRPVGGDLGYRTHARMHADADGRLGFHVAGTHDVVPVDVCPKLTGATQALREEVGDDTGADEVTLRAHRSTGTSTVVLHPGPGPLQLPGTDADLLLAQPDGSVVAMRGEGLLAEVVDGRRYDFHASSFFQVSPEGAQALIDEVRDACGAVDGALVWDLYAGVGLLSLALAADGAEVVAVEGDADAAQHARDNARAHGLALDVRAEPVARTVRGALGQGPSPAGDPPDLVVLDPPRTGAGEDVVRGLARLGPARIVYVACDPAALARDTATLADAGYRLQRAVPLDLFPMTHHVEVVATFVPDGPALGA